MKIQGHLIINNKGSIRMTKNIPSLNWNEISIKLNIELPNTLFNRPMIQANIKLEGDFENKINCDVKENLKELINTYEN